MQRFIDLLMHTKQLYTLWPPMMMITVIPLHCTPLVLFSRSLHPTTIHCVNGKQSWLSLCVCVCVAAYSD